MTFNIFISYSSNDKDTVKRYKDAVSFIPTTALFFADDSMFPGDVVNQRILSEIQKCDLFILFHSGNSSTSQYVQNEIGAAKAYNKPIIPVLIDKIKPSAMIAELNYLDLYSEEKKNSEWNRLYSYLTTQVEEKKRKEAFANLLILAGLAWALSKNDE